MGSDQRPQPSLCLQALRVCVPVVSVGSHDWAEVGRIVDSYFVVLHLQEQIDSWYAGLGSCLWVGAV